MYIKADQSEKNYIESFNAWKEYVSTFSKIPRIESNDSIERACAVRMYYVLKRMRMNPDKYFVYIQEYDKLYETYRVKRTREQILDDWIKWCKENNKLASTASKDEVESKIAVNVMAMIRIAKKEPKKNMYIISKYENIVAKYSLPDTLIEIFKQWKLWVEHHGHTPVRHCNNIEEDKMASRMASVLQRARRNKGKYDEIIREYEQIYLKHNPKKSVRRSKEETIHEWKNWITENGRLPKQSSGDKYECSLAHRMEGVIRTMKLYSGKYSDFLEEYENIKRYYKEKAKTELIYNTFEEWEYWSCQNGRLPSIKSVDEQEKKLATRMRNNLKTAKSYPHIHEKIIANMNAVMVRCNVT